MKAIANRIALCEEKIGYEFSNKLLCIEAFQTSGHMPIWQGHYQQIKKNDRLAILGDVMARSVLCEKWYTTSLSKGRWSLIEQSILTNNHLSAMGFKYGLDRCVILNPGTRTVSPKTMATTVEAIFGAVYLDGGRTALADVLEAIEVMHGDLQTTMLQASTKLPRTNLLRSVTDGLLMYAMLSGSPVVLAEMLSICRIAQETLSLEAAAPSEAI